jgi:hypothetical protein
MVGSSRRSPPGYTTSAVILPDVVTESHWEFALPER